MNSVVHDLEILLENNENSFSDSELRGYESAIEKYGSGKKAAKQELALSGVTIIEYNSNFQQFTNM